MDPGRLRRAAPCSPRPAAHAAIDRRPARPAARPGADLDDRRPGRAGRASGRPPGPSATSSSTSSRAARRRRRPGHDHLHLGHHRPAQGLRAHPPQPARRRAQRGRSGRSPEVFEPPAARPCCSCRWRTRSPGSSRSAAWSRAPCSGTGRTSSTLAEGLPEFRPDVPARRAPGVREGLQRAPSSRPRPARPRAGSSPAAADTADRLEPGRRPLRARPVGPGPAGCGTRLFDRLVYGKLRAAVGGRVRYAVSGGAPLGERLGHFFRGVGHHRAGGLRPDRDLGRRHRSTGRAATRSARSASRCPASAVRIADDGEILINGPDRVPRLLAQRGGHRRGAGRRRLAAHRRPRRARRRGLPAGHRPEEGAHRHRRRQERRPGRARGPAAGPPADQPVPWSSATSGRSSPAWSRSTTEALEHWKAAARPAGRRHGGRPGRPTRT